MLDTEAGRQEARPLPAILAIVGLLASAAACARWLGMLIAG